MSRTAADALRHEIERALPRLRGIGETESAARQAPGQWSAREVLGHLIDSASNNHQRFVRAQLQEDLVFEGYDQEAWVRSQRYAEAPWTDLIELWRAFNLHLARVIDAVPEGARTLPRARHNLDRIAWKGVPKEVPATLEYFMRDYVGHLRHHLDQIVPERGPLRPS